MAAERAEAAGSGPVFRARFEALCLLFACCHPALAELVQQEAAERAQEWALLLAEALPSEPEA